MLKKVMSLLLCAAMLVGLCIPIATATEMADTAPTDGETIVETTAAAEGTQPPETTEGTVPETTGATVPETTEPTVPETTAPETTGTTVPETTAPVETTAPDGESAPELEALFDQIMACATLEELFALTEAAPEEALLALTEEQVAQIEAKITALEPEPLPPVVLESSEDEPVESEIIYPTVNFTNAAPFGDPVVG